MFAKNSSAGHRRWGVVEAVEGRAGGRLLAGNSKQPRIDRVQRIIMASHIFRIEN